MATGELNPSHYPARRAAIVVQHYLNSRYGSPNKLFMVHRVHRACAEDVPDAGRKYQLDISIQEIMSNAMEECSAEVLFPRGEQPGSAEVRASCEELLKINSTTQDEAFYQQHKNNQTLVSAQYLPDSYGHITPGMEPLRTLGTVASSFIMLNQSSENTLYNIAQVANLTQLQSTENSQLKFQYHVLLHDMVSQEIINWKLLFTWSPAEGVKIQQMEQLPHVCEKLPKTN
ncbi:latexin isoform X2 [Brachionichthys hirsutus]|uniref:latexin isoform X2 n=1 Tax=Brachionichthys hirsutus TaxID=412623 RepID=UPI003604B4BB